MYAFGGTDGGKYCPNHKTLGQDPGVSILKQRTANALQPLGKLEVLCLEQKY